MANFTHTALAASISLLFVGVAPASTGDAIDFSGQAKALILQQQAASPSFTSFARGFIEGKFFDRGVDEDESCQLYRPEFVEVDVDDDGTKEGIVTYTVEGCGGGNNWSRLAEVFVRNGAEFRHAGGFQLGSSMFGASDITTIRYGIVVVGNNSNDDPMFDNAFTLKNGRLVDK